MEFPSPLVRAVLVKRYKRFLADVTLENGDTVVAHCANSGSMAGCAEPGMTVFLSPNTNPKAKLDWRWELVEVDGCLVGINTSRPNAIVEEAILDGTIKELQGYETLKREVKYGTNSRIDILLEGPGTCFVEVKNVTLAHESVARFPDAVTARGEKHLRELMAEVDKGNRAVMVYLVNRSDCSTLSPAENYDPLYAERMREAAAHGVELLAYMCRHSEQEIKVTGPIDIDLNN